MFRTLTNRVPTHYTKQLTAQQLCFVRIIIYTFFLFVCIIILFSVLQSTQMSTQPIKSRLLQTAEPHSYSFVSNIQTRLFLCQQSRSFLCQQSRSFPLQTQDSITHHPLMTTSGVPTLQYNLALPIPTYALHKYYKYYLLV